MTAKNSLRGLRDKLLAIAGGRPARLISLHRSRDGLMHRVCVEFSRPDGLVELFFFRHSDGTWHVFPPTAGGACIQFERLAA